MMTAVVRRFDTGLRLPSLPTEVYDKNSIVMRHCATGALLSVNAFDALELVDAEHDPIKVAVAQEWADTRQEQMVNLANVQPFDWTYSSNYKGSECFIVTWVPRPLRESSLCARSV